MKKKHTILKLAIMTFMVLSASFVTSDTLAYWAGGLETVSDSKTSTVTTGEWDQAFPYDANTSYEVGDLVTNNGNTYQAKKSGFLREPGVGGGWNRDWTDLGPS